MHLVRHSHSTTLAVWLSALTQLASQHQCRVSNRIALLAISAIPQRVNPPASKKIGLVLLTFDKTASPTYYYAVVSLRWSPPAVEGLEKNSGRLTGSTKKRRLEAARTRHSIAICNDLRCRLLISSSRLIRSCRPSRRSTCPPSHPQSWWPLRCDESIAR